MRDAPASPLTLVSSPSRDPRLRAALLMPLAALGVHQGRYYLAFGGDAPARLLRDGHAYLTALEPFVLLLAAAAAGGFLGRLARAARAGVAPHAAAAGVRRTSPLRLWALAAVLLLALYCGQELCEATLAPLHPHGVSGILGHGGWIALPLAVALAGVLTLALRLGDALVTLAGRRARAAGRRRAAPACPRPGRSTALDWRLEAGSGVTAGRAPPALRAAA